MSSLPDDDDRIFEALLSMVVIDGDADPDELLTLARVYEELTGREVSPAELRARAEVRLANPGPIDLLGLGERLTEAGKRCVLGAAYAIAAADGFVLDEEDQLLARMADAMGLSMQAYRDALAGLLAVRPQ